MEEYRNDPQSFLIYLFHVATYRFSLPYVTDKVVLDFGCGTGYGTHLVGSVCQSVTGVDISDEAVSHASQHYATQNTRFQVIKKIDKEHLPFPDGHFDVVLSFQVIEHVTDVHAYLGEVRRVLRPDGLFIVATPDRTSRLFPYQKPWNIFHVVEYDEAGLQRLLTEQFRETTLYKMSGNSAVIGREISRTRLLRWISLPFTFPGAPEWLRMHGLGLLRAFNRRRPTQAGTASDPGLDERDIQIGKGLAPSVNLVAVSKK